MIYNNQILKILLFDEYKKYFCIGAGYVGGPTMAVISDKCHDIQVEVVDLNKEEYQIGTMNFLNYQFTSRFSWNNKRRRGINLHFSTSVEEKIKIADMIFISVNTPTKVKGIGAGKASDLRWVDACARKVAQYAKGYTIVVEKSTLPVRTAELIKSILKGPKAFNKEKSDSTFDVLSNPEFLAEGTAINDLQNPDRVLVGGENEEAIELLCSIYKNWVLKKDFKDKYLE